MSFLLLLADSVVNLAGKVHTISLSISLMSSFSYHHYLLLLSNHWRHHEREGEDRVCRHLDDFKLVGSCQLWLQLTGAERQGEAHVYVCIYVYVHVLPVA